MYLDAVNSVAVLGPDDLFTLYSFETLIGRKNDYFATRCSLYPCVTTYGSNVTGSVYIEKRISSITSDAPLEVFWAQPGPWSMATNRTLRNGTWQDCSPSTAQTDINAVPITQNKTLVTDLEGSSNILWYPPDCVYAIGYSALSAFRHFFLNIGANQTLSRPYERYFNITIGPLWLQGLYHNGTANMTTVNQYMEGLTISLSAAMRMNGNTPPSNYPKGTVWESQICVRARWVWISLPAALYALTVMFVAFTVLQTKEHRWKGYWKSSAIALLFHGFDERTRRELGVMRDRSEMYETAEHVQVQLEWKDGDWSFVRSV